ncbi:UDP-2,4-diacetamido-2,4,6-trideoxy-beta-L-altropyranose hydrolase [Persephonella sp.]
MEGIKVSILTEGSKNIGFGHVTRCLSLYQAFEEKGIKPELIINGDDSVSDLVKDTNYELINWLEKQNQILYRLQDRDIVVIDSYLADKTFYEKVSKIVKVPVYIDDNKRIDYPEGVVINGNIYAKELDYPSKKGITYLLGTRYTPLRKEFWEVQEKEIKEVIESIMITFGGDDIRSMTPKVLNQLVKNYPKLKKNIIIGKGFKDINKIKLLADKNTRLIYYPDAAKMREVMLVSDIAISAGGQTLYELARIGVPTIAIIVADNQIKNVTAWEKIGFIYNAGLWKSNNVLSNINSFISKLTKKSTRKLKSITAKKIIDGYGARRIIKFLLRKYILEKSIFRNVENKDIWDIYEISNDMSVRKVSLNTERIAKDEHIKWFSTVQKSNFYVLEFNNKIIGQIRFSNEDIQEETIVSLSLHKDFRGIGIGKYLLKKGIKDIFKNENIKKVVAYVKKDNIKSIKLFENTGFKKVDNSADFLKYELWRESYEENIDR